MHFAHSCIAASVIVQSQQKVQIWLNRTNTARRAAENTKEMTMATASDIRTNNTGVVDRVAAFFNEVGARYARYKTYRETLNEMASLSNRELRDLGLCRSQLRSVAWEHAYGEH